MPCSDCSAMVADPGQSLTIAVHVMLAFLHMLVTQQHFGRRLTDEEADKVDACTSPSQFSSCMNLYFCTASSPSPIVVRAEACSGHLWHAWSTPVHLAGGHELLSQAS